MWAQNSQRTSAFCIQRILILDWSVHAVSRPVSALTGALIQWHSNASVKPAVVSEETDFAQLPETDRYLPSPVLQNVFFMRAWSLRRSTTVTINNVNTKEFIFQQ
jgi:hypothetical protein